MARFRVLNPEGYPPEVMREGWHRAWTRWRARSSTSSTSGSRTRTTSWRSCTAGSRSTGRRSTPKSCAGGTSTSPTRAVRAHPGRRRRSHHRRRHLTGLRAGGLRPRRRSGVEVRRPDRRRARAVFARLVQNAVKSSGMPSARQTFVPTPLMNTSPAGLREYVEGNDPIHERPFMAEVFDQLTRPIPPTSCAARAGTGRRRATSRRTAKRRCTRSSRSAATRTSCRSSSRPRSASSRC